MATAKCRGGPYHGRLMTENPKNPPVVINKAKLNYLSYDPNTPYPSHSEVEYHHYLLVDNPETNRKEWIWEPHLKKLRKRWEKKKEIERIMRRFAGLGFVNGDDTMTRDVQRVLELVYKL